MFGSKKTTIPATGFYALPQSYRDLYTGLLGQANNVLLPNGQLNTEMFTPMGQTADETRAFDMIRQGMAPTSESLGRDISMLMNPYDEFVIGAMNREAQGQNSLVNQAATRAGQMGSNRSFLGTSDVEQQRLNNIGQFRQGQYNTSLVAALNDLPRLRQQDISNLTNIGGFQRELDTQTRQAPLNAINAGTQTLGGFKTEFGDFGSPQRTVKSGGIGGMLGSIGGIVGTAIGGPIGGAIGGGLGGLAGGGGIMGAIQGAAGGYGAMGSSFGGAARSLGSTVCGGLDPRSGINWNSGRYGFF